MEDSWKLWTAVAVLMFGAGFLFIFFFGAQVDYTLPGTDQPTGDFLKDHLPKWFFPPDR